MILGYFITFSCYGARLHGDADGSVDLHHNQYGTPYLAADSQRERSSRKQMEQPPYEMSPKHRELVLSAIQEVCSLRGYILLAAHVRTNHVHVVVNAQARPERVMNEFKVYASRQLNASGIDPKNRKRWARHGSTKYLWKEEQVRGVIRYVLYEQGEPMAVFVK